MALISEITFPLKVPNISKLDKIWSPQVNVQDVPWKILICKEWREEEQWLGIYLYCSRKINSSKWSRAASATFKLLTFEGNSGTVEKLIRPRVFDYTKTRHGYPNFISWADLFDSERNYVEDDAINLEIKIAADDHQIKDRSTMDFKCIERSCRRACLAKFQLTVTNIEQLFAVASPHFRFQESVCWLNVFKSHSNHLGISLSTNKPHKQRMWVRLNSLNEPTKTTEKVETFESGLWEDTSPLDKFIGWDELLKPANGFVDNDSISIEVELSVDWPIWDQTKGATTEMNPSKIKCPICLEIMKDQGISSLRCGHLFCSDCIEEYLRSEGNLCPICKAVANLNDLRRTFLPL